MSSLENVTKAAQALKAPFTLQDIPASLAPALPQHYQIVDITGLIPGERKSAPVHVLYSVYACLANEDRIARRPGDETLLPEIATFSSRYLSPYLTTNADRTLSTVLASEVALATLSLLSAGLNLSLSDEILIQVVPYTDPEAPWTTPASRHIASEVLNTQLRESKKTDFITGALLEGHIRPKLSRQPSKRLTPSGRKLEYDGNPGEETTTGLVQDLPWKGDGAYLISTFRWVVEQSDPSLVGGNWPLFMPLLLAMLDDSETGPRARGLEMAEVFIQRCPSHILRDRGIGVLLEDAMLPTLQFLPSITPEEDSVKLLPPAFRALIQLARSQFDRDQNQDQDQAKRRRLLDRLLRDGVLLAFSHASECINIVRVLAVQTEVIVNELGIYATKHLKDLIPMCGAIMTDPFLVRQPACLVAATKALEAMLLNCWPRLSSQYTGDIVKIICLCWLNLADTEHREIPDQEREELQKSLQRAASLASGLMGTSEQQKAQAPVQPLEHLARQHGALRGLFQTRGTVIDG